LQIRSFCNQCTKSWGETWVSKWMQEKASITFLNQLWKLLSTSPCWLHSNLDGAIWYFTCGPQHSTKNSWTTKTSHVHHSMHAALIVPTHRSCNCSPNWYYLYIWQHQQNQTWPMLLWSLRSRRGCPLILCNLHKCHAKKSFPYPLIPSSCAKNRDGRC
jgi:hypothetical protein